MHINGRIALIVLAFAGLISSCSRPIAKFTYNGDLEAPATIQFENQSENSESYEWDFGDGTLSTDSLPAHRYSSSGNYLVQLKAKKGKKERVSEQRIVINAPEICLVELETEFGNMIIHLYDATPQHRDNFVKLVEENFYEGLLFHRVIDGFMIQGGDPKSKNARPKAPLGSGGPGYQVPAEFMDTLVHVKGALAAARIGGPSNPEKKSSGSQFYIVQGTPVTAPMLDRMEAGKGRRYSKALRARYLESGGSPQLDWEYTVFGQVVEGLDVIDKIAAVKTDGRDRPANDVKMKIRVIK